jgi:Cu/Ag efflux protein CusF
MKRSLLAVLLVFSLAAQAEPADGEVRRVDKDAQKITLRHGPLPGLDMPQPMTMVYRVKDPALLDRVKAGDKVKFQAEKIGGAFTITDIQRQ